MEEEQEKKPPWLDYHIGSKTTTGETITNVLGLNKKCAVYFVEGNVFRWNFDEELCVNGAESGTITQFLHKQIISMLPKLYRKTAKNLLAASLFAALNQKKEGDTKDYFLEVKEFIEIKNRESCHIQYLSSTIIFSIIIVVIYFIWVYESNSKILNYINGGMFGAVGSLVSVLQRFKEIKIEKYSSAFYLSFRGLTRVILGFIFGVLFILLYQSKIILNIAENNESFLYAFCFISGISERFVPELISKIENENLT